MNQEVPPQAEATLEQRIRQWIEDNPGRAHAGERMLEQLFRIRKEFQGDTAVRLEALVEETLNRQLRIDESRRAGLEAAKRLSETVQRLTDSMSQCLVSAKRAHEAAVGAAFSAMQTRTQLARQKAPHKHFASLSKDEKKLMN